MKIKYLPLFSIFAVSLFTAKEAKGTPAPINPQIEISSRVSPYNYSKEEIRAIIKTIIIDITGIDESDIQDESLLIADLGLGSLDMLQLIFDCQEFFEINFRIDDVLRQADKFTFKSFSEMIFHFCNSDDDYNS